MPGGAITTAASLQCPHGGAVSIVSGNKRVKADKGALALPTDTFTISGCTFQLPTTPPIPSPCVAVQWLKTDARVKIGGTPSLSKACAGLCLSAAQVPQGPVSFVSTQMKVATK